ncbi:MAG: hypothetical protein FWG43_01215 [Clostridiales bacterium]|nr:hypothetical protein [Clostridiales bacterium]
MQKQKIIYVSITMMLTGLAAIFFSGCNMLDYYSNSLNQVSPDISERDYLGRIEQVLSDSLEIEKKWLIRASDIPYDLSTTNMYEIEQTYISFSPEIRLRRINDGRFHTLTVKTNMSADGLVREEFEIDISEIDYLNLLSKKEPNTITIHKTRYQFFDEELGEILAIDIFSNELSGLAYMEIEFVNTDEANSFVDPVWVVMDVTSLKEYKNGSLAKYGLPDGYLDVKKQ